MPHTVSQTLPYDAYYPVIASIKGKPGFVRTVIHPSSLMDQYHWEGLSVDARRDRINAAAQAWVAQAIDVYVEFDGEYGYSR